MNQRSFDKIKNLITAIIEDSLDVTRQKASVAALNVVEALEDFELLRFDSEIEESSSWEDDYSREVSDSDSDDGQAL